MKTSERVPLIFIAVILAAVAALLGTHMPSVIAAIQHRHPGWGFLEWSLLAVWCAGVFVVMEFVTRLCQRKKWSRNADLEGRAAAMMYIFFSAITYIFIFD